MKDSIDQFLLHLGDYTILLGQSFRCCTVDIFRRQGPRMAHVLEQMNEIGVNSMGIVCLVVFFVGLVIAMQTSYEMTKFGTEMYVGRVVGLTMFRELGPLIATIVLGGRCGAAIAAEIGTMKVNEEVEALRVMGISPIRFLVAPRILAFTIMAPVLAVISDYVGIIGGLVLAITELHLTYWQFVENMMSGMIVKDFVSGIAKSVVFGLLVGSIACHFGYRTEGGADAVGRATTMSVVTSIVMIIVSDAALTAVFVYIL
ncbi:MAG: ABC transporter permease [Verrucomicrobiae bacterium]|nr:ABC transporter permease [Verrucomicrobiae bacterium]